MLISVYMFQKTLLNIDLFENQNINHIGYKHCLLNILFDS